MFSSAESTRKNLNLNKSENTVYFCISCRSYLRRIYIKKRECNHYVQNFDRSYKIKNASHEYPELFFKTEN